MRYLMISNHKRFRRAGIKKLQAALDANPKQVIFPKQAVKMYGLTNRGYSIFGKQNNFCIFLFVILYELADNSINFSEFMRYFRKVRTKFLQAVIQMRQVD